MVNAGKNNNPVETGYEMDDELKRILGNRYKDISENFTPEAQQNRRNNRRYFTLGTAVLGTNMMGFALWAFRTGLMSDIVLVTTVIVWSLIIGYNIGVCICHNKGWRGA